MKKIMFDTNIFDRLDEFFDKIKNSLDCYEYYITTIQVEELCEIPDSKMEVRKQNLLRLANLRAKLVPLSCFVLNGRARLGCARLGGGLIYNSILTKNMGNKDDALIADTAVSEGCVLITEDKQLYKKMKENNYQVLNLDEFLSEIGSHC